MNLKEQKEYIANKIKNEFKGKSIDENGECQYRHDDGERKCIVGLLIPDNEYSQKIEGKNALSVKVTCMSLYKFNSNLLEFMQEEHDDRLPEYLTLDEQKNWLLNCLNSYSEDY